MKRYATLTLAAALFAGVSSAAVAAPYEAYEADVLRAAPGSLDVFGEHPYHPCHGRTSGTAHVSCGTATGGPSGGLF